jgi:ABC-type multidrug transport system ATPase subunit
MFSARLRLPRSTTDSQLEKLANRMITELGLTSCCDTIVGGELIKGISGGERKRTSVGVELVTKVRTVVECILYASCAMLCGALPSS